MNNTLLKKRIAVKLLSALFAFFVVALTATYVLPATPKRTEENTPVYLYLEFHTEAIIRSKKDFDTETELLGRLAGILERHNARGSFMFLDIYPRMMGRYGSKGKNLIKELEMRGHEIGVHYHPWGPPDITLARTIKEIRLAGAEHVVSLTTSFNEKPLFEFEKRGFNAERKRRQVDKMINDMYSSGITSAFRWCMENTSPYRPERENWITDDPVNCKGDWIMNDPKGTIVAVGIYKDAGYLFPETDDGFRSTLNKLNRVLKRVKTGGTGGMVKYYPVAVHDYFFLNPLGVKAVNRIVGINEKRLEELDDFLSSIDKLVKKGAVVYATRSDVTEKYNALNNNSPSVEIAKKRAGSGGPKLDIFYLIHVHSAGEKKPEFSPMSREEFEGTLNVIKKISRTLESEGAKGVFHFMQNFSEAVLRFQGMKHNIFQQLQEHGHEVGVHAHTDKFDQWRKSVNALSEAGIKDIYSFSGTKYASVPFAEALKRLAGLGIKVVTGNNTPLDPFPLKEFTGVKDWGLGGNNVYKQAGTFMFPWRPDYEHNRISSNNPNGKIIYLGNVSLISWYSGRGPLNSEDFARLKPYFEHTVNSMRTDRINTWGFVTHEVEYQKNMGGFSPSNPVSEEALKALDDFLKYVNKYSDSIKWSTTKNIYKDIKQWSGDK